MLVGVQVSKVLLGYHLTLSMRAWPARIVMPTPCACSGVRLLPVAAAVGGAYIVYRACGLVYHYLNDAYPAFNNDASSEGSGSGASAPTADATPARPDDNDPQKKGRPASNVDQNKQVNDAATQAGLDEEQR